MAQPTPRNYAHRGNHKQYASLTHTKPQKHIVHVAVLTQSKPVSITVVRPVSAAVPNIKVTRLRLFHPIVNKSKSPLRRHIPRSTSSKNGTSPPRVTAVQAPVVSADQGMQGKWVWRPKCPILDHVSRTASESMTLKRFDYNDARGRSKSGTCPIYLTLKSLMVDMLPLEVDDNPRQESECKDQDKKDNVNNINIVNAPGTNGVNDVGANSSNGLPFDLEMPKLEDISTFIFSSNHEDNGEMADMNNLDTTIQVSHTLTIRIHKDHPLNQVIGDVQFAIQTRNMSKNLEEH
nr:hypothetical protein [Tanacetum cinerariifolium]